MIRSFVFFLGIVLFNNVIVWAQDVNASISTTKQRPLVGEPFQIELLIMLPGNAELETWSQSPEQWGSFEVQEFSDVEIGQINGSAIYRQTLDVVIWEPGEFNTPEMRITYRIPGQAQASEIMVASLAITVPSVLVIGDDSLRPLKGQITIPFVAPQYIVISGCVAMSMFLWAYRRWLRWRENSAATIYQIRDIDDALLAALQDIDRQALEPAVVYALTADVLRDFVRDQFRVAAHELTTRELLRVLTDRLSPPMYHQLQQLLSQADLVKFAQQRPNQQSARHYLTSASHWIQSAARELVRHRDEAA